jgi:hypothetical protein
LVADIRTASVEPSIKVAAGLAGIFKLEGVVNCLGVASVQVIGGQVLRICVDVGGCRRCPAVDAQAEVTRKVAGLCKGNHKEIPLTHSVCTRCYLCRGCAEVDLKLEDWGDCWWSTLLSKLESGCPNEGLKSDEFSIDGSA